MALAPSRLVLSGVPATRQTCPGAIPRAAHCPSRARPLRPPASAPGAVTRSQSAAPQHNSQPQGQEQPQEELPPPPPELQRSGWVSDQLLRDYRSCLDSQYYEYDYYIDPSWIEGSVPQDLTGTLFHVGPGLTELYGTMVRSPEDADGMVSSFSFEGGKVFFRNKCVRTRTFANEQLVGRRLSRGIHDRGAASSAAAAGAQAAPGAAAAAGGPAGGLPGALLGPPIPFPLPFKLPLQLPQLGLFNPLDMAFREPANAGIIYWAGRLLACSEGAAPYELNKLSLDTLGPTEVASLARLASGHKVEARPDGSQRLVLMGCAQSGSDTLLRWAEVDERGAPVAQLSYRLPGCYARGITDFWLTDDYYVVAQPPLSVNVQRLVTRYPLGEASFAECLDWDEEAPTRLHLLPRSLASREPRPALGSSKAIILDAPPLLATSCVGSYRWGGSGQMLVLDGICQQGGTGAYKELLQGMVAGYFRGPPKPELTRLTVDLSKRTCSAHVLNQRAVSGVALGPGLGGAVGCPAAAPRAPYRCLYASASPTEDKDSWGPSQVLVKLVIPPDYGVPRDGGFAATTTAARHASGGDASPLSAPPPEGSAAASPMSRRRRAAATAAHVWSPGDRTFLGPPTFVPRRRGDAAPLVPLSAAAAAAAAASNGDGGSLAASLALVPQSSPAALARVGHASAASSLQLPLPALAANEDDGWLLVLLHDADSRRAELLVVDAADVCAGPVAVVRLPHHLPLANRAVFAPGVYCGPARAAPEGWRPAVAAPGGGAGAGVGVAGPGGMEVLPGEISDYDD